MVFSTGLIACFLTHVVVLTRVREFVIRRSARVLSFLLATFASFAQFRVVAIDIEQWDRWISRALDGFVAGLDLDADGVAETVFGFCLDNIATGRIALNVKAGLFDKVTKNYGSRNLSHAELYVRRERMGRGECRLVCVVVGIMWAWF